MKYITWNTVNGPKTAKVIDEDPKYYWVELQGGKTMMIGKFTCNNKIEENDTK